MSRLDVLINRMTAQRQRLNLLISLLKQENQPGIVVELGLGSGRTYDHLRENLQDRDIYTFDYRVECHPSCNPPADRAILGEIQKTLPKFAELNDGRAALIHCDIGSKDRDRDRELYREIAPSIARLARSGTYIASDREIEIQNLETIEVPESSSDWPYFLYRVR